VLRLVKMDQLKLLAYVPNRYIGEDKIAGGKTQVTVRPEGGLKEITSVVTKVYPESDRSTRTNAVEVIIDNRRVNNPATGKQEYEIRGNMYATVDFSVQTIEKTVKIPADAVVKIDEDDYVFVVKDGVAVRKKVTVGVWEGAFVEIEDGLMADGSTARPLAEGVKKEDLLVEGDMLVVGGQNKLQSGTKVNVASEVAGGGEEAQPTQE
jgi:multidrug efflux pump subunit AcrA (membrane-fusion protein)